MKRFAILLLIICLLIVFTACGETKIAKEPESKTYNVEVFDGQYVTITCAEIRNDGVVFDVSSKLENNSIKVLIDAVSLDGQTPTLIGSGSNCVDIEPGQTVKAIYESEIPNTDHKIMSALGVVYGENGGAVEDIDVADIDLGGEEHIDFEEPNGKAMFKNTEFEVDYVGTTDQGLLFRCYNYESYRLQFGISEQAEINNKHINLRSISVCNIAPNSATDYVIEIADSYPDFAPNKVDQFKIIAAYRSEYYEQSPFNMEIG